MKIDWNERIAARSGERGSPQSSALAAEGNSPSSSSKLSSLTEEEEGELAFAIIEETFALEGVERSAPEAALVDALFQIEGEGEDEMDKDETLMLAFELMMAGTDTTTVTLEWALAELAQHPDMLEKVRAEVDAAYAKSASGASETGAAEAGGTDFMVSLPVAEMPYLQALLKETLRHHTTAPILIPHMTSNSGTLGGYHIPPNTMIQINAWALAHDPTVWINPHEFDPSRFLGPDAPDLTGQNFSLLTFGSSRRGCLGLNLAMDLSARLLANFVRRFQIELPEDVRAAGGVDLTEHFALTTVLAKPLRVVLRERKGVAGAAVAVAGS
ncbi:unnamed protein product [Closterium sp. Naga37s-1]|nr:unnamed protein product [Closterium sp. Naga37s-1]